MRPSSPMWLTVQSTSLSWYAEHYAESHSFQVTPWCIDTVTTLRRDAFPAMIRRLLCLPPIATEAAARAFPVDQGDEAGRGDGSRGVVAACGNVETDAGAGTCTVAGRKNPLVHWEGRGAHQVEEVGTGSNAAVEEAAGGVTTMP
jgi:hypothetical protein